MSDSTTHLIGWAAVIICMSWAAFMIYKQKTTKP